MRHLFIAYSRRDFYFAESLFYALQSRGIDAWMDVWKITPGYDWDNAIKNAIHSSQGIILIATKEALQSPHVRNEICRAHQAQQPVYLVMRGSLSEQDMRISHEYEGKNITIPLYDDVRVIVDMRADFTKGLEKIVAAIVTNVVYREGLPNILNFKMEKILYIPPIIVLLTLFMVITGFWKFGVVIFYLDQLNQLMSYIRDIIHGTFSPVLLLVALMIGNDIVPIGALINIIIFGFNFSRRKRVGVSHFFLLLASSVIIGISILFRETIIIIPYIYSLGLIGDFPDIDKALVIILILHWILFIQIAILGIVFCAMFGAKDGHGAILRWLPTGYASESIRRKGNEAWIKNLPEDISVSPSPSYTLYAIVASPEDLSTAKHIKTMFQQKGYRVTDNRMEAECDLIILSPFADDSPLKHEYKVPHPKSVIYAVSRSMKRVSFVGDEVEACKPVIYVVSRSMTPPKDTSIALQWIDYRLPTNDQFWKQWERHFSQLKSDSPVFPYVPEALGDTSLPIGYGCGMRSMMITVVIGSALLIAGTDYMVLLRNAIHGWLLPTSMTLLLSAMGLSYYTIAQMIRGVISSIRARRRLVIAGILTMIAALISQSSLLIFGSLGVVLVNSFMANRPSLRTQLPPQTKKPHRKSLLQPISNYKAFTSLTYGRIMIGGILGLNALITNMWIIPHIPPQFAAKSYVVTVPGPYYLGTPGLWSQDTYAKAFGYRFDYYPDKLEVSQDQVTGYPTWLKFLGINSSPMRFAPHFRSSIHIHFTNNDIRTDFGLVLNDFVKVAPSDPIGPQLRLSASGLWTVIESNGKHYSGQIAKKESAQDYTLEVEVNGILCIYKINGKEITTIADTSMSPINDILFSFASYVPDGTKFYLSNFTYTPLSGPIFSRTKAINIVTALDTASYTTVAPG